MLFLKKKKKHKKLCKLLNSQKSRKEKKRKSLKSTIIKKLLVVGAVALLYTAIEKANDALNDEE
ncbi:MAG: hypothetical protein IKN55_09790 [Oscillospiraceae bacterium]|nr:hypothetical protein [Oscillospiraceae bacterium]